MDRTVFLVCSALYLTIGAVLALHHNSMIGDTQARVANAWYVLFSRDPHLAALGFVWQPLPWALLLPILPFKVIWPALTEEAFAMVVESALTMAGSVCILLGILRDLRLTRPAQWVIVALYALNPMIVYYAANGMSEALMLLTLLLTTRYLMRWVVSDSVRALSLAGIWLAICFLARFDAVGSIGLVITFVAWRAFRRFPSSNLRQRGQAALADAVVVGAPSVTAFVAWQVVSFVITGRTFQYLAIGDGVETPSTGLTWSGVVYLAQQILSLSPWLPIILLAAGLRGWRARDPRPAAAVAGLAGVQVLTTVMSLLLGSCGCYRYNIVIVPLAAVLTACLLAKAPSAASPGSWAGTRSWLASPRLHKAVIAPGLAFLVLAPSIPATARTMADPRLGNQEYTNLAWVVRGPQTDQERADRNRLRAVKKMARYLDGLELPDAAVVTDPATSCVSWMILNSRHPRQFIISNDRDFDRILADPVTFKARFLLVPGTRGGLGLDRVRAAYPGLYENGAPYVKLQKEFTDPSCPPFRLYQLVSDTPFNDGSTVTVFGGR